MHGTARSFLPSFYAVPVPFGARTFTGQLNGGLFWQQQRAPCSLFFHIALHVGIPLDPSSVT